MHSSAAPTIHYFDYADYRNFHRAFHENRRNGHIVETSYGPNVGDIVFYRTALAEFNKKKKTIADLFEKGNYFVVSSKRFEIIRANSSTKEPFLEALLEAKSSSANVVPESRKDVLLFEIRGFSPRETTVEQTVCVAWSAIEPHGEVLFPNYFHPANNEIERTVRKKHGFELEFWGREMKYITKEDIPVHSATCSRRPCA